MIKHKKAFEVKIYKGVQHSFFNETGPSTTRPSPETPGSLRSGSSTSTCASSVQMNKKKDEVGSDLFWGCFVNWAETLEKTDSGMTKKRGA